MIFTWMNTFFFFLLLLLNFHFLIKFSQLQPLLVCQCSGWKTLSLANQRLHFLFRTKYCEIIPIKIPFHSHCTSVVRLFSARLCMTVKRTSFLIAYWTFPTFSFLNCLFDSTKLRWFIQINVAHPKKTKQMSIVISLKRTIERSILSISIFITTSYVAKKAPDSCLSFISLDWRCILNDSFFDNAILCWFYWSITIKLN